MKTIKTPSRHVLPPAQFGFTLIELMIAVAIVAILATIAIPSYQTYIIKSNRRAAQSVMMDIAQKEQQYLLDARQYTADMTTAGLNYTLPNNVSSLYTPSVKVNAGPPPTFTITFTPIAGSAQASDPALSLTDTGVKSPSTLW